MRLMIVQVVRSLQPDKGDTFIGCVQVWVAAHFPQVLLQGQHPIVEDGKILACDKLFRSESGQPGLDVVEPESRSFALSYELWPLRRGSQPKGKCSRFRPQRRRAAQSERSDRRPFAG